MVAVEGVGEALDVIFHVGVDEALQVVDETVGAVRVSFGLANNEGDVRRAVEVLSLS